MHELARLLLLTCLAIFAVSLGFMAAARPPVPERVASYGVVLRVLGRWMYWWQAPLVRWLDARGVMADAVTVAGCVVSCAAAALAGQGLWGLAGLTLMFGSLCDVLDGELARRQGTAHAAGAFLDSTLDRLSEMALFGGLAAGFPDRGGAAWAFAAAGASVMVSYTRARGEALGASCPGGGLERPHRVLILMFTMLFCALFPERWAAPAVEVACGAVALGAAATATARLQAIYRQLRRAGVHPEPR
jgi:CDP-diacylglycerol--glycerol-3-phosphate 3-phosphatidyltransferase